MFPNPVLSQPRDRLLLIGKGAVLPRVATMVLPDSLVLHSLETTQIPLGCRWYSPVDFSNQHPQKYASNRHKRKGTQKTHPTKPRPLIGHRPEEIGRGFCQCVCEGVRPRNLLLPRPMSRQPKATLPLITRRLSKTVHQGNSKPAFDPFFTYHRNTYDP